MNREDAAKLWPIIKAFGEKEKIQYRGHDSAPWQDIGDDWSWISLSGNLWQFRVKPKPRKVRLTVSSRSDENGLFVSIASQPGIIYGIDCLVENSRTIEVELPE